MKSVVKVKARGQVTIPIEIREALDIKEGDLLEIDIKKVSK